MRCCDIDSVFPLSTCVLIGSLLGESVAQIKAQQGARHFHITSNAFNIKLQKIKHSKNG